MTSSPPDISSLSLSSRPSQQRLHDSYDYEGNSGNRSQYHFATSQGMQASPYNPLTSMSQSPLKNKPLRSALPTVCIVLISADYSLFSDLHTPSNGLIIILRTVVLCLLTTTRTFLPLAVPPLWDI